MKKPKPIPAPEDGSFDEYSYARGRLAQARQENRRKKESAKEAGKRGAQARREAAQDAAADWRKRADALRRVNPKLSRWALAGRIREQLLEEGADPLPARRTIYVRLS